MEASATQGERAPDFTHVATWRGFVSLAIVVLVALSSGLLLTLETQRQAALATDVNQAGRMRMLSQRIAVAAATDQLDRLVDSASWLEEVVDHLRNEAVEPLDAVAGGGFVADLHHYLSLADAAILGDPDAAAALPPAAEALLPEVDRTVTAYERLASDRLDRIRLGALAGVVATAFAAGLAWLGVVRPGLRRLNEASATSAYAAALARDWAELLRRQLDFQQALTELSMRVISSDDLDIFLQESCELVGEELEADWCAVMEIGVRGGGRVRASFGSAPTLPTDAAEMPQANYTLLSRNALLVDDLDREERFPVPAWVSDHGLRSSVSAIVPGRKEPFGVLCAHSRQPGAFSRDDLEFLTTAASIIGSFVERSMAELSAADEQSRFLRFAGRASDLIFRYQVEPVRRCIYVNEAAVEVLGHPADDWYDDPELLERLTRTAGPEGAGTPVLSIDAHDQRRVIAIGHPDGELRHLELATIVVPLADGSGTMVEGIARDVTERERANRVLAQALEHERQAAAELREVGRLKDAFLEAVSHELRTPLTVILGLVETLDQRADVLSERQQRHLVARLGSNSRRLDRLLGDLLDLNRLTRGLIQPEPGPVDVAPLVERCLRETDTAGRPVITQLAPARADVDPVMLERIVANLVENAVKHTPEGTRIWVAVRPSGSTVEVVVSDEGSGVAPSLRSTIFEPFRRGPEAPAHAPGHGIGLTLVQRFVEMNGGRIFVTDRPGGGAAFHVELPGVE